MGMTNQFSKAYNQVNSKEQK